MDFLRTKIKKGSPKYVSSLCILIPWFQTGTILSCICCIWDSIPCVLLRILSWCAAEEIPILVMSLFQRNTKIEVMRTCLIWSNLVYFFIPLSSFAFNMKSKNSILAEHLNAKVEVLNALLANTQGFCTEMWLLNPYVRTIYPWALI